jgi:hypothetical protein
MMAGKSTWNLAKAVLALVVQLGLDLLLLPHLGILGAAVGWAASILVANLVPLAQLMVAIGLHPVGRSSVLAVVVCTVAVVPVAAVARLVGGDHLVPALAATAVALLLWAAGLWIFREPLMLDAFLAGRRRASAPAASAPPAAPPAAPTPAAPTPAAPTPAAPTPAAPTPAAPTPAAPTPAARAREGKPKRGRHRA